MSPIGYTWSKLSRSSEWDSFAGWDGGWVKEWGWLEDGWRLARMTRQNLRPRIGIVDVPECARLESWLGDANRLEDSATLKSHDNLLGKVEWVWLKVSSPPIDMTFIDPTFALGALGRGQFGIYEDFTHLRSPT